MTKFRKKPVVIDAEQFDIDQDRPYPAGVEQRYLDGEPSKGGPGTRVEFFIRTLEGEHIVSQGDWIITGVKGERYPCKPDIFAMTYEPVEEPVAQ